MKDILSMIIKKGMVFINELMGMYIQVILRKTKEMGREYIIIQMVVNMKGIGKMIYLTDKVHSFGKMEINMWANGKIIC